MIDEDMDCLMKRLLKQAILTCLKMAVGDCAKHECQVCRIDHPSQKYHDMCLWTSPRKWIEDYGCHDLGLKGLNIYDVMEDFANRIWNYSCAKTKGNTKCTPCSLQITSSRLQSSLIVNVIVHYCALGSGHHVN